MTSLLTEVLAWGGYSLCLLTPYLYGTSKLKGAWCGVVASLVMIAWGVMVGIIPAWLSSVVFCVIHIRNLRIAYEEEEDTKDQPSCEGPTNYKVCS